MSSSPSSVSGAAPEASSISEYYCAYYFTLRATGVPAIDRILSAVASAGKGAHHTDDWGEHGLVYAIQAAADLSATQLRAAPTASREEPSDTAALRYILDSYSIQGPESSEMFDRATAAVRRLECGAAASSSPSAASPEPLSPPIPSREDARDAARLDFLTREKVDVHYVDSGDSACIGWFCVREDGTPAPDDEVTASTPREAIDRAMSAVSHPEAQTNGNV